MVRPLECEAATGSEEIEMSRFMNETITDIRTGRETWRVLVALCTPAFILAIALSMVP